EAITDGGDAPGIGQFEFLEDGKASLGASTEEVAILFIFAGFGGGSVIIFWANAFAVDVEGEGGVTKFGEHFGTFLFVIGQAFPLVRDEHSGPPAFDGLVIGEIAFEGGLAMFVFDHFGMNLRLCGESATGK